MTANSPLTRATTTATSPWALARRAERMNPSVIREILKIAERPGIISLAGGLPSPDSFPVEAMRAATARVLRDAPREALQYLPMRVKLKKLSSRCSIICSLHQAFCLCIARLMLAQWVIRRFSLVFPARVKPHSRLIQPAL